MFSVVIPLYNKELSVKATIQSVLNQTFSRFELIVVDDGSTDGSAEVAAKVFDRRCRLVQKINGGVSSARNVGIIAAKYQYVAFLDGDDLWSPRHLEVLARLIKEFGADADVFATMIAEVKVDHAVEGFAPGEGDLLVQDYFVSASKPERLLSSSSFAIRRDIVDCVGFFDEGLCYGEDVEFWYRIFKSGFKLAISRETTAKYRVAAENRSAARVIPLEKRFHVFNFQGAGASEKMYLGKLALLVMSDYSRKFDLAAVVLVFKLYWRFTPWLIRYGWLLLLKRFGRTLPRLSSRLIVG